MNNKELLVRKTIQAKEAEANSYEDRTCYNAAYCYGYADGATNALNTMADDVATPAQAFVIVSHYSNENYNVNEFDKINVIGVYFSFESAKAAADALLEDDKRNGGHDNAVPYTTDDCANDGVFDEPPLYVAGMWEDERFESYHDLYAVFACNVEKQ